jgi:galactonate dehydratase
MRRSGLGLLMACFAAVELLDCSLGETYPRNEAEAGLLHSSLAGLLLGGTRATSSASGRVFIAPSIFQITGGTEIRVLSAIDLALWDLLGKSLNVPVYRLLGGKSNPEIRLYNTCFSFKYDFEKESKRSCAK